MPIAPVGCIIPWPSGSAVPTGWATCDGTNGTPDLRGRIVACAGTAMTVGALGNGCDGASIPSHTHSGGFTSGESGHTHGTVLINADPGGSVPTASIADQLVGQLGTAAMAEAHDHTISVRLMAPGGYSAGGEHAVTGVSGASAGGTVSGANLPYSFAAYYIQRLS